MVSGKSIIIIIMAFNGNTEQNYLAAKISSQRLGLLTSASFMQLTEQNTREELRIKNWTLAEDFPVNVEYIHYHNN